MTTILKNKFVEIRRIRNDTPYRCAECGRTPTFRYNYRFTVGYQRNWTYSRCQACLEVELVKFRVALRSTEDRLPELPKEQWKDTAERRWWWGNDRIQTKTIFT